MRRLIAVLAAWALACAPVAASAQGLLLLGVGNFKASGGGGYVGPGDVVGGATAWYGLRAYSAAIAAAGTQKLVKVYRASDSHNCDILVATSGGLGNTANCSNSGENGTAAATWCNATTCSIDTWYDQAGTNNATQSTNATRPTLVFSCLGSLPCATFSGAPQYMTTGMTVSQPLTVSAVAIRTASFSNQQNILVDSSGPYFNNTANQVNFWFGGGGGPTAATDNVWHALQFVANGGSSAIAADATQNTGLGLGAAGLSSPSIGAGTSGSNPLTGKMTEVGIWPSAFSTGQMTSMCHNQYAYWGTSTAC